jgi:signal transduction histidine kinase
LHGINRENYKVVKLNPEEKRSDGYSDNRSDRKQAVNLEEGYKILIVSASEKTHEAVLNNLKYFSFSGNRITILRAHSLQEAKIVTESNPDIVLVVIDNNVQLNGSYKALIDYVRDELKNEVCCFAFKEGKDGTEDFPGQDSKKTEAIQEFEFARDRLLEVIRMMMLTADLESKTEGNQLLEQVSESALKKTQGKYQQSDSITREKLYTILAHDIKEPIGNIKVILDFLTNEPELLDMKTSQDLLKSVKESASSIHELLDNFLFWTRMHRHEIYFNPVRLNIAHLVRENITLLKGVAMNKNIIIGADVSESITVIADEYMMTTVMRNLIYNAIKFTSRGGGILVMAQENNGQVELSIQDTGIGFNKSDLDNLFKPDVYIKSPGTSRESGMGLGLILCKDFIEKNGGKLNVESDEGFGSTFTFTLPKWNVISVN